VAGKDVHGRGAQVRNSPIVTQNVVTYNVVVRVDNRELFLKPGMTANVSIEVEEIRDGPQDPQRSAPVPPAGEGNRDRKPGKRTGNGKGKETGGSASTFLEKTANPFRSGSRAGFQRKFTVLEEGI